MVLLYTARAGNLGPGDFLVVECGACGRAFRPCGGEAATGHDRLIHPAALPAKPSDPKGLPSLGLAPDDQSLIWPLGCDAGNATRKGKPSCRFR
jgi:hypothetical protein